MNRLDNKAHTLTELILASAITVILIASVLGAFIFTKRIYASSIAMANLQRDADVTLKKIIKGEHETTDPAGVFRRLSEAKTFKISKIYTTKTKLEFTVTDNSVSSGSYYSDSTGTSILHHHPGSTSAQDETIYTAPPGATLVLQFAQHDPGYPPGDVYTNVDVCINLMISQNVYGRNISGSATAMLNIRNHP